MKKPGSKALERNANQSEIKAPDDQWIREPTHHTHLDWEDIFQAIGHPTIILDPQRSVIAVNRAGLRRTGRKANELIGKRCYEIFHNSNHPPESCPLEKMLNSGEMETKEMEVESFGGVFLVSCTPVFNNGGQLRNIIHIATDITEKKETMEALLESKGRLALAVEGADLGVWDWNVQTGEVMYSKGWIEMLGYCEDEIKPNISTWEKLIHPDDMPRVVETVSKHHKGRSPFYQAEFRLRSNSGKWHWVLSCGKVFERDIDGKPLRMVGIHLDINRRKNAEEALWQSEEHLKRALPAGKVGVWDLNLETGEIRFNAAPEDLSGLDIQEIPNTAEGWLQFLDPVERQSADEDFQAVVNGLKTEYRAEHKLPFKDGSYRWFLTRGKVLREGGKPIRVLGTTADITDLKEAEAEKANLEQQLFQAQKMEAIGTLAGGIAHDFNNILTPILANISIAKTYGKLDAEIAEMLTDAQKVALRAKGLTQQLLTFSKGGAPVKKPAAIPKLLIDSAKLALSGSNVRCEYSIAEDIWPLQIDEGQIGQVIHNMALNADQAMPTGGTIKISAQNVIVEPEDSMPLRDGRHVKISITDQGIGIPEEHLPRIFDPFFSTKDKGSGLGLTTSFTIVNRHDGTIQAESELGFGTIFHIYLPASKEKVGVEAATERTRPAEGEGKILVIDDDEVIRKSAGEVLKRLGYEVNVAKDHAEGINLYAKAMKEKHPYDAVIMDLTIPGSMGGKEAINKLKKIDQDAKVILSSGYSDDRVMSEFRKYGFCGVVAKPYEIEDMAGAIHNALKGVEG